MRVNIIPPRRICLPNSNTALCDCRGKQLAVLFAQLKQRAQLCHAAATFTFVKLSPKSAATKWGYEDMGENIIMTKGEKVTPLEE